MENSTISGNGTTVGAFGKAGTAGKAGKGRSANAAAGEVNPAVPGTAGVSGTAGDGGGGGIFSQGGILYVLESTIAANSAAGSGGGLDVVQNTTTHIHNSTIAFNTSAISGGGLFAALDDASDPVDVISSIISANKSAIDKDVSGTITGSSSPLGVDFMLGKLALHGGTTATIIPAANSPAVDHGADPDGILVGLNLDQRGLPRLTGAGIDIGAVEQIAIVPRPV